jgi:hypothetical protein
MNGIEIEIRRSTKSIPARSRSVSNRTNDHDKKSKTEQSYWDYSSLYGKKIF